MGFRRVLGDLGLMLAGLSENGAGIEVRMGSTQNWVWDKLSIIEKL